MPSNDIAISVRGVSKSYTIAHNQEKHSTLAEAVLSRLKKPMQSPQKETFWALRDVSFDIKKGDVVGIIGRNGAGKSTLLKILSRITGPTTGEIAVYGRVGSLLEVGTGFHPELTGRENVFLNGSILGMSRGEIRKQFDAIVDFAGVEKFLDTPVKRYSSGMYVRLAFAVAAHLNPEILIVDEVLAVGDVAFQKKCMGKMGEVAKEGKTVLFVSHNSAAVARLCISAIFFENGTIRSRGQVGEVLTEYAMSSQAGSCERIWEVDPPGNQTTRLVSARMIARNGNAEGVFSVDQEIGIEMVFDVTEGGAVLYPNIHLFSEDGTCVFVAQECSQRWRGLPRDTGRYIATAWIPPHLLSERMYVVGIAVSTFDPMIVHFFVREALTFQTTEALGPTSARGDFHGHLPGMVRPILNWEVSKGEVDRQDNAVWAKGRLAVQHEASR